MTFKIVAGGIYKLSFPFTGLSSNKARPALALEPPDKRGDVRFVFITTQPPPGDEKSIFLQVGDFDGTPLPFKSYLRLEKIFLLHEYVVKKPLAMLTDHAMGNVYKQMIINEIPKFYSHAHKPDSFIPGTSHINYAGRVFDHNEIANLVDASLEFWLTYGRFSRDFEKELAKYLGIEYVLLVNSGSSANLLAFMALTSPLLGDKRIKGGDEVITVAAAFPTTVTPIIQYGAVPVFVDVNLKSANIKASNLGKALSAKTKAVILAHTLGNPFDIMVVKNFCVQNNLWFIEDNCDALGSRYLSESAWSHQLSSDPEPSAINQYTGTFGDIGTSSFYPPHHITMGEGGAVYTSNKFLKKILLSMRDWGRDCWCESGRDNTCGKRFSGQYGTLPFGYDHKYVYSHFGYNLKPTDMQAAVGLAQLQKLSVFTEKRKSYFTKIRTGLKDLDSVFILPEPTSCSDPSWFGFLLILRDDVSFTRNELVIHLEKHHIQTRNLFSGNLTRHPCFEHLREGVDYRIIDDLQNTDKIMRDGFWIGVYPGMKEEMLDFTIQVIRDFVRSY